MRAYFAAQDVLEVDTPALAATAVSDTQIESFAVTASRAPNAPLFLHTSPEFCMKRLLAAGYPDIYSVCRVFRDGEAGRRHQPEFTMVEWYRLGLDLDAIVTDAVAVINSALGERAPAAPAHRIDYRDAFVGATGLDPRQASIADLSRVTGADGDLQAALGDERDDWLDLALTSCVIPRFATDRLTVLRHYPASQAALARLCPGDPSVADRFEVFLGACELANGYVELTDAAEQARRIDADNAARRRRGLPVRPVDDLLLAALDAGLPECAGVALGLERLQMLHDGTDHIRDVITFTFEGEA